MSPSTASSTRRSPAWPPTTSPPLRRPRPWERHHDAALHRKLEAPRRPRRRRGVFGLAALVWPGITLYTLVLLWGAFALVDGITALSAAIADRLLIHRGWVALSGIIGIGAGIVTFLW